jgi:hypothetical protein
MYTAVSAARAASSEASVANRIVVGKMLIYYSFFIGRFFERSFCGASAIAVRDPAQESLVGLFGYLASVPLPAVKGCSAAH